MCGFGGHTASVPTAQLCHREHVHDGCGRTPGGLHLQERAGAHGCAEPWWTERSRGLVSLPAHPPLRVSVSGHSAAVAPGTAEQVPIPKTVTTERVPRGFACLMQTHSCWERRRKLRQSGQSYANRLIKCSSRSPGSLGNAPRNEVPCQKYNRNPLFLCE